jgi:hypothetical protein
MPSAITISNSNSSPVNRVGNVLANNSIKTFAAGAEVFCVRVIFNLDASQPVGVPDNSTKYDETVNTNEIKQLLQVLYLADRHKTIKVFLHGKTFIVLDSGI